MLHEYRLIMYPKDKYLGPITRCIYACGDKQANVKARYWLSKYNNDIEPRYALWRWVEMERKE